MVATVSQGNRLSEIELDDVFGVTEPVLALEVQGSTYPRWGDSKSLRPEKSVRISIKNETQKTALSERLESALWTTMPIASIQADSDDTLEELIRTYNASWSRLNQLHEDLRQLVRSICTANVEWRSESETQVPQAQQTLVRSAIDEMAARVTRPFGPSPSVLTAEVATLPLETVRQRFSKTVRNDLQQFCRLVESSLKEMTELQLIGIIQWVSPNVCKYHFFTEVLCHDGTTTEESNLKYHERPWEVRRESFLIRFAAYVEKTTTALVSVRRARHEHLVFDAFQTTIANSKVTTLPRHRQLLNAIPKWLYDFVRIVDGALVHERVIQQECCRKKWCEVEIIDKPQIIDIPLVTHTPEIINEIDYELDPAIVIDQYALSGWGPREIQQEKQRQVEERVAASRASSDVEWRWWLTGVVPTALAFIGTAGFRPDLWPLAILALTACLFTVIQTVAMLEHAGKETAGVFQYATSLLTTLAVCIAGALLISCFRGPVGVTPWWFLVSSMFAVVFGFGLFSAFESLKSFAKSDSSSSQW